MFYSQTLISVDWDFLKERTRISILRLLIVSLFLLGLSPHPLFGQQSVNYSVSIAGSSTQTQDTRNLSFRFYFNVTNTGSQLDYITIPRGEMKASDGSTILGVPSPEFGVSLAPGASALMFVRWDVGQPTPGTYKAEIPFKSELTGCTCVKIPITAIVVPSTAQPEISLSGKVVDFQGQGIGGATVKIVNIGIQMPDVSTTKTDPGGRFTTTVRPGKLAVRVDAAGFSGQNKVLNASSGQFINLDFVLMPVQLALNGEAELKIASFENSIWTLGASEDLRWVASAPMVHNDPKSSGVFYGLNDGRIIWSVSFGSRETSKDSASQFQALDAAISVSGDGRFAAGMDWNGWLHLINMTNGNVIWKTDRTQDANTLYPPNSSFRIGFFTSGATAFSPDGSLVAGGGSNGYLVVFNSLTGDVKWKKSLSAEIRALKFTPDGKRLAVGSGDWKFHMLDALTGDTVWAGKNEFWPFFFIAMDQSGDFVGTGGKDGAFNLWNAKTGDLKWRKDFLSAFVTGGGISDGGKRIMISDWTFGVWYFDGEGNLLWFRRFDTASAAMTQDGRFIFVSERGTGTESANLYLLDSTGTTVWEHSVDLTRNCKSTVSPFPKFQFRSVLVSQTSDGKTINGVAGCIGGSVYHVQIPVKQIPANFRLNIENRSFDVAVLSNSTITDFNFRVEEKAIKLTLAGVDGKVGFSNMTFPKVLINGTFTVTLDGVQIPYQLTQNATHLSIYTTYLNGLRILKVIGTTVIPEFPINQFLVLAALLGVVAILVRLHLRYWHKDQL
jgi:WD40 repeat protein